MNTVPKWFYIVSAIALLWNLVGLMAVGANLFTTPEQMSLLSPEQQAMYQNIPSWSVGASIVAVVTGTLGSLSLLLKKAWSESLFIISMIALAVQNLGTFIIANGIELAGSGPLLMQTLVFIIAIGLIVFARNAKKKMWCR